MHKKTTLYVKRNIVSCVLIHEIRAVKVLIRDSFPGPAFRPVT